MKKIRIQKICQFDPTLKSNNFEFVIFQFFFMVMAQEEYKNEITSIFTYINSPKTPEKLQK